MESEALGLHFSTNSCKLSSSFSSPEILLSRYLKVLGNRSIFLGLSVLKKENQAVEWCDLSRVPGRVLGRPGIRALSLSRLLDLHEPLFQDSFWRDSFGHPLNFLIFISRISLLLETWGCLVLIPSICMHNFGFHLRLLLFAVVNRWCRFLWSGRERLACSFGLKRKVSSNPLSVIYHL